MCLLTLRAHVPHFSYAATSDPFVNGKNVLFSWTTYSKEMKEVFLGMIFCMCKWALNYTHKIDVHVKGNVFNLFILSQLVAPTYSNETRKDENLEHPRSRISSISVKISQCEMLERFLDNFFSFCNIKTNFE